MTPPPLLMTLGDPISTDPDSGFQTYDKMVEYWTTNHCVAVLSNKISASEDIKSNCSIISKDPSFSSSLASLGTCSGVDNYGALIALIDLTIIASKSQKQVAQVIQHVLAFVLQSPKLIPANTLWDTVTPIGVPTIQPIDQNAITDQTSSSGSPFATGRQHLSAAYSRSFSGGTSATSPHQHAGHPATCPHHRVKPDLH
ncbi:MAG: hypothetical protein IPJ71_19060 [Bdellovibrionales bacterium]|nr:hypothetical protein [Bdellovibrionales bacterium]